MTTSQQFEPERAVEVIEPRYGSAYRIGGRLVLTAAHLVKDSSICKVRSKRSFGEVEARVVWKAAQADVVLIELPEQIETCESVVFGLLPEARTGDKLPFQMYGYPKWSRTQLGQGKSVAGRRQIEGVIYLGDTSSADGLLVLESLRSPEGSLDSGSDWEGISGAAIICEKLLVAVQRQHQNPKRPASLEAELLTSIYDDQKWQVLLKQHGINSEPLIVQLQSSEATNRINVPYFYPRSLEASTFVGRGKELQKLHELLQASPQVGVVATTGMGGIGKTQLAWQYAHQHKEDYPSGIWWLTGSRLVEEMLTCRIRMKLPEAPDNLESDEARVQWYYDRWVDVLPKGMRLLIWDDVSDYGSVRSLLPQDERYRVLLTTREKLSLPVQRLELGVLKLEDSLELLRCLVGDVNRVTAEVEEAQALCEWVGCLPLGIELIGRHLAGRPTMKLSTLLSRLEEQRLRAKAAQQVPSEMPYRDNLEAAFELSWRLLDETAKQLGGLLSVFALAPVKQEWVAASLRGWDEETIEEAEGALFRWSLVSLNSGQYLLHTLIREFFAQKLIGELKAEMEGLQKGMAATMIAETKKVEVPEDVTQHHLYNLSPIIPHLKEVAENLFSFIEDNDFILLFQGLGRYYEGQELYNSTEKIYKDCKERSQKRFGLNHLNTLRASYELAKISYVQGSYSKAEELQREALSNEIFTDELMSDSEKLLLAEILNSLGLTLKAKGNYAEAEELYNRSLEIRRNLLESDHFDISDSLNNLALLYGTRNGSQDAEPLLVEALRIRENQFGNHHLRVAASLNNLASCYDNQKRFEEAEQLYSRSLDIYRDLHGKEHQDIAKVLNNLAQLYTRQDKLNDAEPLFLEALEIQELVFGKKHPDIVSCLSNIAGLYTDLDNAIKAEFFYKKSLSMGRELLGKDHISVAITMNNFAKLYQKYRKYDEAEPLYIESLKVLESSLGEDHDISVQVRDNLNSLRAILKENNL